VQDATSIVNVASRVSPMITTRIAETAIDAFAFWLMDTVQHIWTRLGSELTQSALEWLSVMPAC